MDNVNNSVNKSIFQLFTPKNLWISFFEFRTLFFFFPIDFFPFVQGTQFGLFCTSLLHEEQEGNYQNDPKRYGQPGQAEPFESTCKKIAD